MERRIEGQYPAWQSQSEEEERTTEVKTKPGNRQSQMITCEEPVGEVIHFQFVLIPPSA